MADRVYNYAGECCLKKVTDGIGLGQDHCSSLSTVSFKGVPSGILN